MAKAAVTRQGVGFADDTLTSMAYRRIRDDIIRNKLKPGDCLSSPRLARDMNMSRTPVREALSMLAKEGLVDVQNGVGIFIKTPTHEELAEIYEVRVALECAAVEALAVKYGLPGLKKLASLKFLEREWVALRAKFLEGRLNNFDEVLTLDYKTHDFIVESSGNFFLMELVENIKLKIRRIQNLSISSQNDVLDAIAQHLGIIKSIREGDLEESRRLLKVHIREAISYIFL